MRLMTKRTLLLTQQKKEASKLKEPVKRGRGRPAIVDEDKKNKMINFRIDKHCDDIVKLVRRKYLEPNDSAAIRFIIRKFGQLLSKGKVD